MDRVNGGDIDYILLQAERQFRTKPKIKAEIGTRQQIMGFSICIPESMILLDKEKAAKIFWSQDRPEICFFSEYDMAGMTFQILEGTELLGKECSDNPMERIKEVLYKLDDRTVCYDMGEIQSEEKVYWIEYKSFAVDMRVYNLIFLYKMKEKEILGQFFCPFEKYDEWKPTLWEIIRSIKEHQNERIQY